LFLNNSESNQVRTSFQLLRPDSEHQEHSFKVTADQANVCTQNNSGICVKRGDRVSIDFKEQHIILNFVLIKELLLVNSILVFLWTKSAIEYGESQEVML
jgi:hypothetical protein